MTLTKDQILNHMLGINLFLTRAGDIVRVTFYDMYSSDSRYPISVIRLTGEDRGDNYHVTAEGSNYANEEESEYDLVALITADDLQRLAESNEQPTSKPEFNIDLMQCMRDRAFLKTRYGEKAIVLAHVPEDDYAFKGVLIDGEGFLESASWTEDGKYSDKDVEHDCDIVGLWGG